MCGSITKNKIIEQVDKRGVLLRVSMASVHLAWQSCWCPGKVLVTTLSRHGNAGSFSTFISDLELGIKSRGSGEERRKDLTELRRLKCELQGREMEGSASQEGRWIPVWCSALPVWGRHLGVIAASSPGSSGPRAAAGKEAAKCWVTSVRGIRAVPLLLDSHGQPRCIRILHARCCPGLLTSRNRQRRAEDPDGECCTFLQVGGLCNSCAPRQVEKLQGSLVSRSSCKFWLFSNYFKYI